MRKAAYAVSMVALVATVAPAFVFYSGRITLDQLKLAMNAATLAWFVATPLWMGRDAQGAGVVDGPTGATERSL